VFTIVMACLGVMRASAKRSSHGPPLGQAITVARTVGTD
jgi:hypothetical protein